MISKAVVRADQRIVLGLLLIAHLALTIAYSVITPLGEAPDEADHWAYTVYLARERSLPEGPAMTQAKHPPLYHVTAALVASLAEPRADFLRANPDIRLDPADWDWAGSPNFFIHTVLEGWPWRDGALAFHLARIWSALLSTLTVWATFGLLRAALPDRPAVAWAGAGLLAFLPEFAFIGGSANNDNLAALCGTLALWGGLAIFRAGGLAGRPQSARVGMERASVRDGRVGVERAGVRVTSLKVLRDGIIFKAGWWTPLALGFGLLAKVSTAALWPVVGGAVAAGVWAARAGTRQSSAADVGARTFARIRCVLPEVLITGLLVFLPALLLAAPWFWRNWTLYGDPLGMELARQTVDVRVGPWTTADTAWLLRGWFISFWGKFGGAGHIPMADWLYALLAVLTILAGLGLIRAAIRGRSLKMLRESDERFVLALLVLAVALTALGIWRYSLVALGTDQGRLLYPVIGALVGLVALGWLAWIPQRWMTHGAVMITLLSLLLGLYGLFGVIQPAFAPPPSAVRPVQGAKDVSRFEAVAFGELMLIGSHLDFEDTARAEPVLYWTAVEPPTQDWRVTLRVIAEDGSLAWEWKRSPGSGRWSTDHWPVGYVMRDAYQVTWPEWAGPGRYRVEVGVSPFGGGLVAPGSFLHVGWLQR